MDVDVDVVQLSKGLEDIFVAGEFSKCVIDVASIFEDTNEHRLQADSDGFLSLACLDALRRDEGGAAAEFFVPVKIFVRSEMQVMFSELLTKSHPSEIRKILTGSPGVGKSVLFFLTALRYQLLPENTHKKVAYFRKVDNEKDVAFFLMEPGDRPSTLKMLYSRQVSTKDHPTLFDMWKEFRGYTKALKAKEYVEFVDGPKHLDTMDLLNKAFDFLCTSGGYPPKHQSEIFATDVKILSGWQEERILEVLTKLGHSREQAKEIYAVSGGRIRLAIWGTKVGGLQGIKKYFDDLIFSLGQEKVVLAFTKTDSSASVSSSDRLRTRFLNYDGKGSSLLIVDSFYAMTQLRGRLDFDDFMSSFLLAGVCRLQSARGWFFEEIMHLWFKNTGSPLITDWVRSKGDATEAIAAINRKNLYWIPAAPNFANIDAAFVCGSILVCIQYTVSQQHGFNKQTFWQDFASHVRATVPFTSVAIWFVSPRGTNFKNTHTAYSQPYTDAGTALRSQGPLPNIAVSFEEAEVTCESTDSVNRTTPELGFLNPQLYNV